MEEALRRVSAEIEHSAENLEALREAFGWMPELNAAAFLRELGT